MTNKGEAIGANRLHCLHVKSCIILWGYTSTSPGGRVELDPPSSHLPHCRDFFVFINRMHGSCLIFIVAEHSIPWWNTQCAIQLRCETAILDRMNQGTEHKKSSQAYPLGILWPAPHTESGHLHSLQLYKHIWQHQGQGWPGLTLAFLKRSRVKTKRATALCKRPGLWSKGSTRAMLEKMMETTKGCTSWDKEISKWEMVEDRGISS